MRILMYSGGTVPIPPVQGGGSERQIFDLGNQLVKDGHHVTILDRNYVDLSLPSTCMIRRFNLPIIKLRAREGIISDILNEIIFGVVAAGYLACRRRHFDIVQVHGVYTGLIGSLAARLTHLPIIYRCDNPTWTLNERFPFRTRAVLFLEALAAHSCRGVMVHCEEMKMVLIQNARILEERIHVVRIGVNTQQFKPGLEITEKLKLLGLDRGRVVLFAGRVVPEKGIDLFIKAIPRIIEKMGRNDLKFVVAGPTSKKATSNAKSSYFNYLTGMVVSLGLESLVTFTGRLPEGDLRSLLSNAWVFVFPSRAEAQPGVVIEAMSSGIPVVGSAAAGIPSAVQDGKCGAIMSSYEPGELSDLIAKLLNPGLRNRYSVCARHRAIDEFSWEVVSLRFVQMCTSVIGRPEGTGISQ